jgi:hypothetical protein
MVRSRVYNILAGYEDQNDHDTPRAEPDGGKGAVCCHLISGAWQGSVVF